MNHIGNEGSVYVGAAPVLELTGWSLDITGETVDDSTLGEDWRTKKSNGKKAWAGSMEGFYDETDTTGQVLLQVGAEVALNFYYAGNTIGEKYFSGSAIITGVSPAGEHEGMLEASYTFEGNGALTEPTVAV